MNKSSAMKIISQTSMALKNCLGISKGLSKEKLFGWLYEITPQERAELSLLKTLKKLNAAGQGLVNAESFIDKLSSCTKEEVSAFLDDRLTIKKIKERLLKTRADILGISNGKPFETIDTKDLDWLRFVTKDLDLYRWKDKFCNFCNSKLSTDHLKTCPGTLEVRKEIEHRTGIQAIKLLADPSLLNSKPLHHRKIMKKFVAARVSRLVHSAARGA